MADNDVIIRVKLDSNGVYQGFEEIGKAQDKLAQKSKDADTQLKSLVDTLKVAAGIKLGKDLFEGVLNLADKGDQFNDVAAGFDELSQKAGGLSDVFLGKLREATLGSIDNLQLMRSANDALIAGLSPEQFEKVAQVAKKYGDQLGLDTTQAVNTLSNAIQTGSSKALKSFGIYLDGTKVLKDYAESVGVTGKEQQTFIASLDAETVAAIKQQAALEKLKDVNVDLSEANLGVGDTLGQVKVARDNLVLSIASEIDTNAELKESLVIVRDALRDIDAQQTAQTIAELEAATIKFGASAVSVFSEVANTVLGLDNTFQRGAAAIGNFLSNPFDGFSDAIDQAAKDVSKVAEAAKQAELKDIFEDGTRAAIDFDKIADPLGKKLKAQLETNKQLAESTKTNALETAKKNAADRIAAAGVEKHNAELEKAKDLYEKLNSTEGIKEYAGKVDGLIDAMSSGLITQSEFRKDLEKLKTAWETGGGAADRLGAIIEGRYNVALDKNGKKLDEIIEKEEKLRQEREKAAKEAYDNSLEGSFLNTLFKGQGDTKVFGDSLANGLSTAIFDGLSAALNGKSLQSTIQNAAAAGGEAIGTFYGGQIGGAAGKAVGDRLGKDITNLGKNTQSTLDLTKDISYLFAPVTGGLSLAVQAGLERGFGQTGQDKLRKQIDSFFNSVGIDLTVKGNTGAQVFDSLSESAQSAFAGISRGLSDMRGIAEKDSLAIGNVLAANVGGNLNTLQVLIGTTGIDLGKLGETAQASFEKGQISASKYLEVLDATRVLAEKGIPGAIGAVTEAFDNFINSGANGAFVIDSLGDQFEELKERGVKTLDGYRKYLESTGKYNQATLDKYFAALQSVGIDTVEEIGSASTETAARLAATLENQGDFFKNQGKTIQELLTLVNQIPDKIEKDVVFNVSANFASDEARQVASGAGLNVPQGKALR